MKKISNTPSPEQEALMISKFDAVGLTTFVRKLNEAARISGFNYGFGQHKGDEDFKIRQLALIHSEVSEALEALRIGDDENFIEELADILIRTFDLAGSIGVENIGDIIANKHAYNVVDRPITQGNKHGKRF